MYKLAKKYTENNDFFLECICSIFGHDSYFCHHKLRIVMEFSTHFEQFPKTLNLRYNIKLAKSYITNKYIVLSRRHLLNISSQE